MSSDDEYDSDDYGRPKRGAGSGRGRGKGRKAKSNALRGLGASLGSSGGPSKVKLKVKAGGHGNGKRSAKGGFTISTAGGKDANVPPQWQGYADRELDSDTEEPLVFEESFILRMPIPTNAEQTEELNRFTEMVKKREPMDEKDVWFKFMDSRRAVFNLGQTLYNAKLVDLPCMVESQKTNDGKHMFKTADISQMLLVEHPIASEQAAVSTDKPFNIEDYIYPHGLTPPLRHVRKRRFKPRINKQAIEIVERQVERLLELDEEADDVKYEMVDESEIQEDDAQRTQAEYEAEFAGINMSLDPALSGAGPGAGGVASGSGTKPRLALKLGKSTNGAAALAASAVPQPENGEDGTLPAFDASIPSKGLNGDTSIVTAGPLSVGDTPAAGLGGGLDGNDDDDGSDGEDGSGDGEDYRDEGDDDEEEESDAEGYDSDLAAMIEGGIEGGGTKGSGSAGANGTGHIGGTNASSAAKKQAEDASDASGGSEDDEGDSDDLFGKGRSDDDDDDEVNMPLGDTTVQDNEETLEAKRRIRLMADEMKDLDKAVNNKKAEFSRAPNPMLKKRFGDVLNKLSSELELKKAQHAAAQNRLQAAQNEIKRQEAEEHAAANPQAATAAAPTTSATTSTSQTGPVAGTASSHTLDSAAQVSASSRADPAPVFGTSSSRQAGSAAAAAAGGEAMQIDRSHSRSPAPAANDGGDANGDDDIAVSSKDFAVPSAMDEDGDDDDLFGDGDD